MVDLVLTEDRLIVNTLGSGLLDRLRTINVSLSDLQHFCLLPTIGVQNIISRTGGEDEEDGEDGDFLYDHSFDAEFVFSYRDQGKLKKKRVFVNSHDEVFQELLATLESNYPTASLLNLEPEEARKRIGVMSPRTVVWIIVTALVGVPAFLAAIILTYFTLTGFKE